MADQHNTNIPAMGNQISNDIPDIKENLEFHKDVLQKITGGWSDSATTNVVPGNAGAFKRSKFEYSSTTAIKLYPAFYHHAGTTDQMCYWSSTLTFTLGSGGSNSGSEDLDAGAVEIQYIYLDDSAIVTAASNVISNSEILNSSVAPAWDDAQYGWYPSSASGEVQTTDRCIGAVAINASNQVIDFDHDGGRYFEFAAEYAAYSIAYPSTDWSTQVTFRAPTFCTRVHASFDAYADGAVPAAYTVSYREGSDSGNGHTVGRAYKLGSGDENQLNSFNSLPVTIDGSQQIDIKVSQADANAKVAVRQNGWYLPIGM